MRPIKKKESPYTTINHYSEALPHLKREIGEYCSYCELRLDNAPEVEHVFSKSKGGSKLRWENLLLACKQCNTRKGSVTGEDNIEEYAWPDEMNTAIAYSYDNGIPRVNSVLLDELDPSRIASAKATALFQLVHLGDIASPKDHRFNKRLEAYELAKENLEKWKKIKYYTADKDITEEFANYRKNHLKDKKEDIITIAKLNGFFSVWVNVFKDESEIVDGLVEAFAGTNKECFESGTIKKELLHNKVERTDKSTSL